MITFLSKWESLLMPNIGKYSLIGNFGLLDCFLEWIFDKSKHNIQKNVSYGKAEEVVECQNSSCEFDINLRSLQLCFIWLAKCLYIIGAEITWALEVRFVFQYFLDSNIASRVKSLNPSVWLSSQIHTSLWSVFHQACSTVYRYSHCPRVKSRGWEFCHLLLVT